VASLYHSPQSNLDYSVNLVNSSINEFLHNIDNISAPDEASDGTSNTVVPLPFQDQKSVNSIKRKMQNLSAKIGVQIKPVFQSKKISQVLPPKEKPPIGNNQCVVYKSQYDLCNTDYVQGSKLTVVRLSRTTKITMGQPNCAKWLPLGKPNLSWH